MAVRELLGGLDLMLELEALPVEPKLALAHINSHASTVVRGRPRSDLLCPVVRDPSERSGKGPEAADSRQASDIRLTPFQAAVRPAILYGSHSCSRRNGCGCLGSSRMSTWGGAPIWRRCRRPQWVPSRGAVKIFPEGTATGQRVVGVLLVGVLVAGFLLSGAAAERSLPIFGIGVVIAVGVALAIGLRPPSDASSSALRVGIGLVVVVAGFLAIRALEVPAISHATIAAALGIFAGGAIRGARR